MDADIERIRSALFYLSADMPRNEWVEIAMALKSELGEDGFELFNKWSEKSDKYNARDIRDTWRSCTPDGGITIATLFFRAKQAGWRNDGTRPTKEELAAQRRRSTERAAKEKAERARKQAEAAKKAAQIWKAAKSALDNPYLIRKSISPVETLRQIPDNEAMEILGYAPASDGNTLTGSLLVAPIYVEGLASVEFVDEGGCKSALAGGKKKAGFGPRNCYRMVTGLGSPC